MQVAAAGVLAQSPRSLVNGKKLERDIKAPFDAVFQTVCRPDNFMILRKSVSEVKALNEEETDYCVKEIFMGAQAEFVISVYPYYDKGLVNHYGKAEYFCVDASISYHITEIDEGNCRLSMEYSFVIPSLIASFSKNIIAKDRKSQLEAIAQHAEANVNLKVSTLDASREAPPLNLDRVGGSSKKEKKEKKAKKSSSKHKDTVGATSDSTTTTTNTMAAVTDEKEDDEFTCTSNLSTSNNSVVTHKSAISSSSEKCVVENGNIITQVDSITISE